MATRDSVLQSVVKYSLFPGKISFIYRHYLMHTAILSMYKSFLNFQINEIRHFSRILLRKLSLNLHGLSSMTSKFSEVKRNVK
jgi:hypothetical protein